MSKKSDAYIENEINYFDELFSVVTPSDPRSLALAIEKRNEIQDWIKGHTSDEKSAQGKDVLQEQQMYIDEYVENIGEFDNTMLNNNICYLIISNGFRVGEVEKILNISTGYLSRVLNEGTRKRISIDIVWKIAALFRVDIESLLFTDLKFSGSNSDLIARFLIKLKRDTAEGKIEWHWDGGGMVELKKRYFDLNMVIERDENSINYDIYNYSYIQDVQGRKTRRCLTGDIISCSNFIEGKDLVMVPYATTEGGETCSIDCLFVWNEKNAWKWQKVFYTMEDAFRGLDEKAVSFYKWVIGLEFDALVSPDIKHIITNYLRRFDQ